VLTPSHRPLLVPFLAGPVALTALASAGVAPALPALSASLGLGAGGTSGVMIAYALGFAVGTASFGHLADVAGAALVLRIGLPLLAAGAVLAAAAPSLPSLLAGRLVEGIGAGAVPVFSLVALASIADQGRRRREIGAFTAVLTATSAAVLLAGGALADLLGWRVLLAVPAAALLFLPGLRHVGGVAAGPAQRLDLVGIVLLAALSGGLLLGLQVSSRHAVVREVGAVGLGCALAAGLALARRGPGGVLPRSLVASPSFVGRAVVGAVLFAGYFGLLVAAPLLLAAPRHWSPVHLGLVMLPAGCAGALASRLAGGAGTSLPGARHVPGTGTLCALAVAGLAVAAAWPSSPAPLVTGLALASAALGWGHVVLVDGLADELSSAQRGIAMGLFNLAVFFGGGVGATVVGLGFERTTATSTLAVLACLPALGWLGVRARRALPA
jgi:MFS family permease